MTSRKKILYSIVGLLVVVGIILGVLGGLGYLKPKSGGTASSYNPSGTPSNYQAQPGTITITGYDPSTGTVHTSVDSNCRSCVIIVFYKVELHGPHNQSGSSSSSKVFKNWYGNTSFTIMDLQFPSDTSGNVTINAQIFLEDENYQTIASGPMSPTWTQTVITPVTPGPNY